MARTILVVEDETTLRETLADALEVEGFRVVAALALAFGLAFGLGGRDVASQLTQAWYTQSQAAAAKVKASQAASDASSTSRSSSTSTPSATPKSASAEA